MLDKPNLFSFSRNYLTQSLSQEELINLHQRIRGHHHGRLLIISSILQHPVSYAENSAIPEGMLCLLNSMTNFETNHPLLDPTAETPPPLVIGMLYPQV